jgi:hypothetical protein
LGEGYLEGKSENVMRSAAEASLQLRYQGINYYCGKDASLRSA